jgi:hypothetical protein
MLFLSVACVASRVSCASFTRHAVSRVVACRFTRCRSCCRTLFVRFVAHHSRVSRVLFARVAARCSRVSRALPCAVRAYRALSAREIKQFAYNYSCELISYSFNRQPLK